MFLFKLGINQTIKLTILHILWLILVKKDLKFPYMVPVVQARQVYSTLRIDMFTLPYDHAGCGSQEADGRCERKGIQEPKQDGQVIWVPCEYIIINRQDFLSIIILNIYHMQHISCSNKQQIHFHGVSPWYLIGMFPTSLSRSFCRLSLNAAKYVSIMTQQISQVRCIQ